MAANVYCRLCLRQYTQGLEILQADGIMFVINKLLQIEISESDMYPKKICKECFMTSECILHFYGRCKEVDVILHSSCESQNGCLPCIDDTNWKITNLRNGQLLPKLKPEVSTQTDLMIPTNCDICKNGLLCVTSSLEVWNKQEELCVETKLSQQCLVPYFQRGQEANGEVESSGHVESKKEDSSSSSIEQLNCFIKEEELCEEPGVSFDTRVENFNNQNERMEDEATLLNGQDLVKQETATPEVIEEENIFMESESVRSTLDVSTDPGIREAPLQSSTVNISADVNTQHSDLLAEIGSEGNREASIIISGNCIGNATYLWDDAGAENLSDRLHNESEVVALQGAQNIVISGSDQDESANDILSQIDAQVDSVQSNDSNLCSDSEVPHKPVCAISEDAASDRDKQTEKEEEFVEISHLETSADFPYLYEEPDEPEDVRPKKRRKKSKSTDVNANYHKSSGGFPEHLELEIVKYVQYLSDHKMALTEPELAANLFRIAEIEDVRHFRLKQKVRPHLKSTFLRRHRELRKERCRQKVRGGNTSESVNNFIEDMDSLTDTYGIRRERVFSTNEVQVSAREGNLSSECVVTVNVCVNYCGTVVPPLFVYPLFHMNNDFLQDCHPSCKGTTTTGEMKASEFLAFLHHLVADVKPTAEDPIALIVSNKFYHKDFYVVKWAKTHHIILFGVPPLVDKNRQQAESNLVTLFKSAYENECAIWESSNQEQLVTMHNVAALVSRVLYKPCSSKVCKTCKFKYYDSYRHFLQNIVPQGSNLSFSRETFIHYEKG